MNNAASLDPPDEGPGGERLVQLSMAGTALFVIVAGLGVATTSATAIATIVSFVLFAIGCVVFLLAFAGSVERSRTENVSVFGVYLLIGSAPGRIKWRFHAATIIQIVVAIAAASARPFTAAAFGILVPMFGLGMSGLWGARHGVFAPRTKGRVGA